MAVKIRLKRTGMPKQASFRVVAVDSRKPRDGEVLESFGFYSPYKKDKPLKIDMDRYHVWIEKGALPTESVKRLVKTLRKRGGAETITPVPVPVAVVAESTTEEAPVPKIEVAEPVAEPVAELANEPVVEPVIEPAAELATEPVAEPVAEPVEKTVEAEAPADETPSE